MSSAKSKDENFQKHSTSDVKKMSSPNDFPDEENLKSIALNLLTKSSVYAVAQLVSSNGSSRKILWFVVLLVGILGCSYEVYRFLTLYFQYPVVITLEVQNTWKQNFPAVTVCNLNRIPVFYYDCLLNQNKSVEECMDYCTSRGGYRSEETFRPVLPSAIKRYASCSSNFDGVFSKERSQSLQFLNRYLSLSKEQRSKLGHQSENFIKTCTFNGESCSISNFSNFLSIEFGNCFTFNGNYETKGKTLQTPYIGPNSGLELTLNLEVQDYSPITPSIGARVVIHKSESQPNPEDYGININPGSETSVAIRQTSIYRLPHPYRDKCRNYEEQDSISPKDQEDCIRKCMQSANLRRCGCVDPFLPSEQSFDLCDIQNQTSVCCLDEVMKSLSKDDPPCPCPLPCESTRYEMTISTALWPARSFYKVKNHSNKICTDSVMHIDEEEQEYLTKKSRIAKLKVFYQTLEKSFYKQEPMFQESELFSQLGGQMGLWLGISLVALFECIENISHILHYCIKRSGLKKKRVDNYCLQPERSVRV
ncbi:FMRFamide-activated amiloride-sensitive sodium like protein [Argiope bruennichi]|uniref:FMRFamide-activated amiloride-sensitive sodium like protein n=1 Tax=Argiope bruennichi TaxID=94029 RepID=A0A8T0FMM1_ARGBR|nr:FMRFamide-activated amiloride-sensitive sodium like protein [Argiope bruennichi]